MLCIVKKAIPIKLIYRGNKILSRIPADYFWEIKEMILKVLWNCKGLKQQKQSWKEQTRRIHTFCFQNLIQSNGNKTLVVAQDKYVYNWNRIEESRNKPIHLVNWLIFDKVLGLINGEKNSLFFYKCGLFVAL